MAEAAAAAAQEVEMEDDEIEVFETYAPSKLKVGKAHPTAMVETVSLSYVAPPDLETSVQFWTAGLGMRLQRRPDESSAVVSFGPEVARSAGDTGFFAIELRERSAPSRGGRGNAVAYLEVRPRRGPSLPLPRSFSRARARSLRARPPSRLSRRRRRVSRARSSSSPSR